MLSSVSAERPSLGAYNPDRLGTSIFLATGGALAFFAGGIAPTPFDLLIKGLGIAAVGYGAYHLFVGPGGSESKLPEAEAFDKIYGEWILPQQNQTVGVNFWGNSRAQIKLTNPSDKEVDFTLAVTQTEACKGLIGSDTVNQQNFEPRTISLPPGGQKIESFDAGVLCSAFRLRTYITETLVAKKFRYGTSGGGGGDLDTITYKVEL